MITNAFLKQKQNVTVPIKLPKVYAKSGYYPTSYSITFDETRKEYSVSLDNLTYRAAPQPKAQTTAKRAARPTTKSTVRTALR
jgi:hypothetical protein